MVDVKQAMEGKYINPDVIRNSATKKGVFIDEGEYEDTKFGARLHLTVELDGQQKIWSPNKDSVRNISEEFGTNSKDWVGKTVKFSIGKVMGKDVVNGVPIPVPKMSVESI